MNDNSINIKLHNILKIGDNYPPTIMGVLNLSPESFYKGSVYENEDAMKEATNQMIKNGAKMLDLGARSTAPWSKKITIEEELNRIMPAMEIVCKSIPNDVIISIDTQYSEIALQTLNLAKKHKKKIIINDVSCLKTDPSLSEFLIDNNIPIIIMASKTVPGDLCTLPEIISELNKAISQLINKGYNENNIIIDPGIGHWIEEKTYIYDLKIIGNLKELRVLNKPVLVAISRKSFIGSTLNIPEPENRLNGTLSATVIAVFNGAHIIRTHDVNNQLLEMVKIAEEIRKNL